MAAPELATFTLPAIVDGKPADVELGKQMVSAWAKDGIFQVARNAAQDQTTERAFAASRRFFEMPMDKKSSCVSDLTFAGYIASGEELTAGEQDYSEIFTICKDLPLDDARVQAKWPCHGPVPWPDAEYARDLTAMTDVMGGMGDKLLQLVALGLGLDIDALKSIALDGWHHARVLRFPTTSSTTERGIGAHTDYGLLVIAAQDEVGGLYVRPPIEGEKRNRNWLPTESMAGMYENEEPWHFVKPVPSVFTVFPGDILQLLTDGQLLSTPHKVRLNNRERFAVAYFHEPNFDAIVRPLSDPTSADYLHYGTHFTNMFTRCYPERVTTKRIEAEDRMSILDQLRQSALAQLREA
jgi:isopenicillin N synthase-like dioxygenase